MAAIFSVIDTASGGDTWYEGMVKAVANWAILETELTDARGSDATLDDRLDGIDAAMASGSGVLVSANDTTIGYLNGKLIAGEGIDFTENNDGGNESLTIAGEDASATNKGILEISTDAEAGDKSSSDKALVPTNLVSVCFPKVLAKTSAHSIAATEVLGNIIFTNKSAAGAVNFTLPAATVGLSAMFEVRTAQYLRCTAAATETIEYGGSVGSASGYVRSNVAGTSWTLQCREAGKWTLLNRIGVIKYDE